MRKIMQISLLLISVCLIFLTAGCSKRQSASANNKMVRKSVEKAEDSSEPVTKQAVNSNAIVKETSTYDCDMEADRNKFDGNVDIVVGDYYYATQINDWFMEFDQYKNKTVEIEGYYIGDFKPYDFIGRYGPTCPYCQGGYVCFEILSDEDLSQYQSGKDWIKVTGILREGNDSVQGPFYYIEVMKLEKMEQVGQDTVSN